MKGIAYPEWYTDLRDAIHRQAELNGRPDHLRSLPDSLYQLTINNPDYLTDINFINHYNNHLLGTYVDPSIKTPVEDTYNYVSHHKIPAKQIIPKAVEFYGHLFNDIHKDTGKLPTYTTIRDRIRDIWHHTPVGALVKAYAVDDPDKSQNPGFQLWVNNLPHSVLDLIGIKTYDNPNKYWWQSQRFSERIQQILN